MIKTDHPLDHLDAPTRIRKRAQYEVLQFELLVTNVLVRNESHADSENHEYLVVIDDGLPVSFTHAGFEVRAFSGKICVFRCID